MACLLSLASSAMTVRIRLSYLPDGVNHYEAVYIPKEGVEAERDGVDIELRSCSFGQFLGSIA